MMHGTNGTPTLASIASQIQAVADRQDARDEKIDALSAKVDAVSTRLGIVEDDSTTRKLASIFVEGAALETAAKRASLMDAETERKAVAEYRVERRALLLSWVKSGGVFIGGIVAVVLARKFGIVP